MTKCDELKSFFHSLDIHSALISLSEGNKLSEHTETFHIFHCKHTAASRLSSTLFPVTVC